MLKLSNILSFFAEENDHLNIYYKFFKTKNIEISHYNTNDKLNSIIFYLYLSSVIEGFDNKIICHKNEYNYNVINFNHNLFTLYKIKLISMIRDNNNLSFDKKKLEYLINTDSYNNELLLTLCTILNINIFILHKDINIVKLYYPEEIYNIQKNNIFLVYCKNIYMDQYFYQILTINNHMIINYDIIILQNIINYIYTIGINENKKFITSIPKKEDEEVEESNLLLVNDIIFKNVKIYDKKYYKKILKMTPYSLDDLPIFG